MISSTISPFNFDREDRVVYLDLATIYSILEIKHNFRTSYIMDDLHRSFKEAFGLEIYKFVYTT